MIAIYTLSGIELQLAAGSGFTINVVSTVFNDGDEFLGSYSYPVSLAYTPENNKALGMANRLENRTARQDMPVNVRILGTHWKRCTLNFTLAENAYSAFLKIDNGEFGSIIKNKLLPAVFDQDNNGTFIDFNYVQLTYSKSATVDYLAKSCAEPGKHPVYFFPLKNMELFGSYSGDDSNIPYDDSWQLVNPYVPGSGFNGNVSESDKKKYFYTPFFSLTWVLQQVLSFLGYQGAGDLFTDPYALDKVIYNTGFFGYAEMFASEGLKLAPAKHLPAITIGDFFKKLRTQYKLAIYFDPNTQTAYFNYGKKLLRSRDRVDLSGYISPQLSIKSDLPEGYELVQPVDSGDTLFKNLQYTESLFVGSTDDPKKVDSFIGTLFNQVQQNPLSPGNTWRVPRAGQTGNAYSELAVNNDSYNATGYGKNSFDFRLLTYRGLQADSAGNLYPYAAGDALESNEQPGAYPVSNWLDGDQGILQVYNYDWYIFYLRTELVELTAQLPFRILQQLTPTGMLEFQTPSQVLLPAILNDLSFEASQNEKLLQAKIRVYMVYAQQALPQAVVSKFKPGTVINPGNIYVRFKVEEDFSRRVAYTWKNNTVVYEAYYIYTLSFFSDAAGTVPREVSNLEVLMHKDYKGANPRNYYNYNFSTNASGSVFQVPVDDDHVYHYKNDKDFWQVTFSIVTDPKSIAGLGYTIIT